MLTRLEIQNFKTFGESIRFDMRPLSVLIGPNGSGKSSVLDAVGLLAQSTPAPEQPPQFRWKDRHLDLGSTGTAAFHKPDHDLHLSLTVEIEASDYFSNWAQKQNFDSAIDAETLGYRVTHRRATEEWKHQLLVNGEIAATNHTVPLGRDLMKRTQASLLECNFPSALERVFEPASSGNTVLSPKLFMGTRAVGGNDVNEAAHGHFMSFGLYTSYIAGYLKQRVFMVGPNRIPARETPQPDSGPLSVGRRGERTITVLSVIFANPRHLAQARKIQHWASAFGLPSLTSGWVREELLHAGYLDPTFDTPLGFESAGCGAQHILPVITQIFAAPKNSVILIEEPEAGLHPEAQHELAKMLADAINYGQQLVLTTHSQALITALRAAVESAHVPAEDVAIYRLSKSQSGAKAARLRIEELGQIDDRSSSTIHKVIPVRSSGASA